MGEFSVVFLRFDKSQVSFSVGGSNGAGVVSWVLGSVSPWLWGFAGRIVTVAGYDRRCSFLCTRLVGILRLSPNANISRRLGW